MRDRGRDSRSPGHDRFQKGKSRSCLRDTRIVPGHVATFPSQILGYLFRRTTQNAKGVGKPGPETMGRFPITKLRLGEMHAQTIVNCRSKKWPFPDPLPTVGCSEKISLRQGDPQRTNIIIQPKNRTNIWVSKRDKDKLTRRPSANRLRESLKTEFTRGPGRGDTCHLSFLDETLPDWRYYPTTLKDKVGRLWDFSVRS